MTTDAFEGLIAALREQREEYGDECFLKGAEQAYEQAEVITKVLEDGLRELIECASPISHKLPSPDLAIALDKARSLLTTRTPEHEEKSE
jgi:hypothetical protein